MGLVLAAGASMRMRPLPNKLTQRIDDERVLVAVPVDAMIEAGIDPVFVVLGNEGASVREFLGERTPTYLSHPGWEAGIGSSIAAGVRGILETHRPKGILVCVGDLPGLRARWLLSLVDTFVSVGTNGCICVPTHAGRHGHPVLFGAGHFAALMELDGDRGGRIVVEANPEEVREVEIDSDAILRDIDTPADLEAWRSS